MPSGEYLAILKNVADVRQDRRQLRVEDLIEPRPPQEEEQSDTNSEDSLGIEGIVPSPKVQQLVQILRVLPFDSKSLVFSQFTSFLDIVCSFDCVKLYADNTTDWCPAS